MQRTILKFVTSGFLGMAVGVILGNELNDQKRIPMEKQNPKREDYLKWKDYFMSVALVSGQRSKDRKTQVGACIANENNRIVGVGYNGFPDGCSDDEFPWDKDTKDQMKSKHLYVVHAESNAIINRFSADLNNCTMYVTRIPCNECAKLIIQTGIKKVVYMSDYGKLDENEVKASIRMFLASGVACTEYHPEFKGLNLDLTEVDNQNIVKFDKQHT